jgi:hypothetical protein
LHESSATAGCWTAALAGATAASGARATTATTPSKARLIPCPFCPSDRGASPRSRMIRRHQGCVNRIPPIPSLCRCHICSYSRWEAWRLFAAEMTITYWVPPRDLPNWNPPGSATTAAPSPTLSWDRRTSPIRSRSTNPNADAQPGNRLAYMGFFRVYGSAVGVLQLMSTSDKAPRQSSRSWCCNGHF